MMGWIYTFFIYPILYLGFWLLSWRDEKVRQGFQLRKNRSWIQSFPPDRRWVWFHVASGELEYAKPVIRALKKPGQLPKNTGILVTYFSPSVLESLRKTSEIDLFVPMPWDTPWHWKEFLRHYKPLALAIARTDTWPNMVWQTRKAGIPSLLFSATLPSHSGRYASFWGRFFYGCVVEGLTEVSCVSDEDREHFLRLSPDLKIAVEGDTRFDQVIARVGENRPLNPVVEKLTPTLVAGSTWPEDEKELLPSLQKPVAQGLHVIIAPHEPSADHLKNLEEQLRQMGLASCRYSALTDPAAQTAIVDRRAVILIDRVGILADLYRVGAIAFVGGSFKKSIHSVMEPAASGCLTLMGPYHYNNREAGLLKRLDFAREVHRPEEIERELLKEMALTSSQIQQRREQIQAFVQKNRGVSDRVAQWVKIQAERNFSEAVSET